LLIFNAYINIEGPLVEAHLTDSYLIVKGTVMPIIQAILNRRSVRRFADKPVDRKILETCLEAAHLAPSASNSQPWRFLVLDDPEKKHAFGEAAFHGIFKATQWAMKAPVLLVICANRDFKTNRLGTVLTGIPFYLLDVGMAGEHFALQAVELGLGTCWIGWFDIKKARRFLKLPRSLRICSLMATGYPATDWKFTPHKRKELKEIVRWNGW
jgi:nitroreductase